MHIKWQDTYSWLSSHNFIWNNINIKTILIVKHLNKSSTTNIFLLLTLIFILKDRIKTVDSLVHIIQLLKPGSYCHCHKSYIINFANYFRQSLRAFNEVMDHGLTLIWEFFGFNYIDFFIWTSLCISRIKSRSTPYVEILGTCNDAKRRCKLQMYLLSKPHDKRKDNNNKPYYMYR